MPFDSSRWTEKQYVSRLAKRFAVQKLGALKVHKVRIFKESFKIK